MAISFTSQAWNARGHMIIAAIAYQEMSEDQQASVTDILKQHPEYNRTWKPDYDNLNDEIELGLYLFIQASVWADKISENNHPQHHLDAPKWHYMNYKLTFPYEGDITVVDEDNVLQAIKSCERTYKSRTTTDEQKAIAISWLAHLVGDIHQPLHSVSLFSDQYPDGDRGGNRFWIKDRGSVNLHSYWDGLLGKSTNVRDLLNEVVLIRSNHQKDVVASKLDPVTWGLESFKLAREAVYLNGKLKGGVDKDNAPQLPEDYGKHSKKVGEERIAQAGYRLVGIL